MFASFAVNGSVVKAHSRKRLREQKDPDSQKNARHEPSENSFRDPAERSFACEGPSDNADQPRNDCWPSLEDLLRSCNDINRHSHSIHRKTNCGSGCYKGGALDA
jgi:hypothetical protein